MTGAEVDLPGYQPTTTTKLFTNTKSSRGYFKGKKTAILAGAGILHAKAMDELKEVCRKTTNSCNEYTSWPWNFPGNHELLPRNGRDARNGIQPIWRLHECDVLDQYWRAF